MQDDIRYTGLEIGAGAYRPSPPAVVLERRFGDCKDKVLLFVTLMRALGFESHPALVHSELGRGIAERVPGPGAFDHAIAKLRWKGRDYWLDATTSGQGGTLATLAQADFGLALVLAPARGDSPRTLALRVEQGSPADVTLARSAAAPLVAENALAPCLPFFEALAYSKPDNIVLALGAHSLLHAQLS